MIWINFGFVLNNNVRALVPFVTAFGRDVLGHPSLVEIVGAYHNLLRQWSET